MARIVFDPVGGPTVAKLVAAMAERGILFLYGALSAEPTTLPLMDVLAKSFPFDQIVEAHRYMESNQQVGKIVVMV
jgi:NADPH:quinone reductase-like Zn-dependent oxidoreductase